MLSSRAVPRRFIVLVVVVVVVIVVVVLLLIVGGARESSRRDVIISRPKFRDNGRVSDFRASAAEKSLIKLSLAETPLRRGISQLFHSPLPVTLTEMLPVTFPPSSPPPPRAWNDAPSE